MAKKILKVRIELTIISEGNGYHLERIPPPEYDSTKIDILCNESVGNKAAVIARNDGTDYRIGLVEDKDAAAFLASDDIEEITEEQANELGVLWRPQETTIASNSDMVLVSDICDKLFKSQAALDALNLTSGEKKLIDVTDTSGGIIKTKAFPALLTERLNG